MQRVTSACVETAWHHSLVTTNIRFSGSLAASVPPSAAATMPPTRCLVSWFQPHISTFFSGISRVFHTLCCRVWCVFSWRVFPSDLWEFWCPHAMDEGHYNKCYDMIWFERLKLSSFPLVFLWNSLIILLSGCKWWYVRFTGCSLFLWVNCSTFCQTCRVGFERENLTVYVVWNENWNYF